MNKELLSYLPFNLFWCLPRIMIIYLILSTIFTDYIVIITITSIIIYLFNTIVSTYMDYYKGGCKIIDEQIKNIRK